MEELWLFVVDTNQYAGNFERPMCAYMTGVVGECGVGGEYMKLLKKETGLDPDTFFSNVSQQPDDHACYRPATICETPGWFNDGMGNEYQGEEGYTEKDYLKAYVKAITDYFLPRKKQAEENLRKLEAGETIRGWTVATAKQEIARHQAEIDKAKNMKKVHRYPACMSVGIWFESKPSTEQVKVLKERATQFCKIYKDFGVGTGIKIGGFRIIKQKTVVTKDEESV